MSSIIPYLLITIDKNSFRKLIFYTNYNNYNDNNNNNDNNNKIGKYYNMRNNDTRQESGTGPR